MSQQQKMDYYLLSTYQHDFNSESYLQRSTYQHDYNPKGYMQRSTYKHDYSKGGGANRGRSMNYPPNVAPPADINPPAEFYRAPARIDPGDHLARDLERLDFDDRTPRTERRRPVKRGEEWVPGRRYENYDEPQTDRGYYRSPERNGYEQERGRNASPDRVHYDRGRRRDDEQQRRQTKEDFKNIEPTVKNIKAHTQDDMRTNYHDRDRVRHTSIDRYYDMDGEFPARQSPHRYNDQDRVRHTSMDRHYDRDFSPQRSLQRQNNRDYDRYMQYLNRYERPRDLDAFANQGRFIDRTTYKDYGEFMGSRMRDEERKRMTMEQLAANQTAHHDGVYLFIRANKSGRDKIIHALKRNRTVLGISGGKLKGIAEPSQVHVIEGSTEGWFSNGEKDIFVCVLWFDSDKRAIKWIEYDKQFKHPSFPDPRGCDMMIAPINWEPNDLHYRTFLVMEYKGINEDQKAKIRDILARHQKGSGGSFVVQTAGVRNYRGDWMKPNTLMTCHVFQSTDDAERFVKDSEFTGLRNELKRTYGAGINSVAFTVDQLY